MGKNKSLSKQARDYILDQMRDNGEMTKDQLMDLIRPHFSFDPKVAKEQAISRYANKLVASLRDEQGNRTSFTLQKQNLVVNIEKSINLENVRAVEEQLRRQLDGLQASHRKALKRKAELEGQTSLFNQRPDTGAVERMA